MSETQLTEKFLAKAAGWEAMKEARKLVQADRVLSSSWQPPVVKGRVQTASNEYSAGMVIKGQFDIENLCRCPKSRRWGTLCAHSVAIALHTIVGSPAGKSSTSGPSKGDRSGGSPGSSDKGEPAKPIKRIPRTDELDQGVEARIHLILPPNWLDALRASKVMCVFEAETASGRGPLNMLPSDVVYRFSLQDERLVDELERSLGEAPAVAQFDQSQFSRWLGLLVGHPRMTIAKKKPLSVSARERVPSLRAQLEASGELRLTPTSDGIGGDVLVGDRMWCASSDSIWPLRLSPTLMSLFSGGKPLLMNRKDAGRFLYEEWGGLATEDGVDANFTLADLSFEPRPPAFSLHLEGGLARLQAALDCRYGKRVFAVANRSQTEGLYLPDEENPRHYWIRDLAAEKAAEQILVKAGFIGPDAKGIYKLAGQDAVLRFLSTDYQKLEKQWEVRLEERLEWSIDTKIEKIEPQFSAVSSGEQWFDLHIDYQSNQGTSFTPSEIQEMMLSGRSFRKKPNGKFLVIDTGAVEELEEILVDCEPTQESGGYKIRKENALYMQGALAEAGGWELRADSGMPSLAEKAGVIDLKQIDLSSVEAKLRAYQLAGVQWLWFLREGGFSGILADEMGLGKTLQSLAFLDSSRGQQSGQAKKPCLVVCPTSLVTNWVTEAQRFTPGLKVAALHGADRERLFDQISTLDLIVTSYALIRRDVEKYRNVEFDSIVLDEAQQVKNPDTQASKAVRRLRGQNRLALTGTPIENSVRDLWSIFEFLMPGYLGSAKIFKERYEVPISKHRDEAAQKRLSKRTGPFILRRLKRDVAKDLPEKLEQISYCELSREQKALYQSVLDAGRKEVFESVQANGMNKSRMVILTALLRLRQICCDGRLIKADGLEFSDKSGKIALFEELIQEAVDGEHRTVVFSQFTSMLQLLKTSLDELGISYCYLDGTTKDRASEVGRFQSSEIPVFLMSLKAGGVGLNITAADTVMHVDPWWNPAVEAQATDRVHRIGQSRVVTSYKLIAKETVEEKILNLQRKKKELIASALSEEDLFKEGMTWDELKGLFD